jgi:hypothetical protein
MVDTRRQQHAIVRSDDFRPPTGINGSNRPAIIGPDIFLSIRWTPVFADFNRSENTQ